MSANDGSGTPGQPGGYGGQPPSGHLPHGQPPHGYPPHTQQPYGQPGYPPGQYGYAAPGPMGRPPRKSKTGLIIAILVAVLVVAGAVVVLMMNQDKTGDKPTGTDVIFSTQVQGSDAVPAPKPVTPAPTDDGASTDDPNAIADIGSLSQPMPMDTVGTTYGEFLDPLVGVQVQAVNWDANSEIPTRTPPAGYKFIIVTVKVTNLTDEPFKPHLGMYWEIFSAEGTLSYGKSLVKPPNALNKLAELAPGESAEGDITFEVPADMNSAIVSFFGTGFESPRTYVLVD